MNRSVTVLLDRERRLEYNLLAFAEIEKATGLNPLGDGLEKLLGDPRPGNLIVLIWAGLISEDPELTQRRVAELVSLEKLPELMEAVAQSFKQALPERPPQPVETAPV